MSARGTNSPLFSDRSGRSGSAGSAGLSPSYSVSQAGVAALRGSRSPHRHKISRKASRQGDDLTPPAAGLLSRVPMLKTVFLTVLIVELAAALFLLVRTHQDHAVEVNERNDARLLAAHAAFVRAIRDGMLQYAKQVEFFRGMVPLVSSAEEFAAIFDVPLLETVVTYTEIVQHDDRDQFEQATFDDWQGLPGAAQVSRNITEVQVGTNSIVNGTRVRPVQPMYLPVRFGAPPEDTSWFVLRDVLGDPWRKALNEAALQNPSAITLVPRSVSKFDGVTQTASAFLTGVVSPTNSSQVVGTLASVFFWQSFLGEYLAQQPHENVRIKLFDVTPNSPGQLGCDSPLLFSGVLQDDGQWSVVPAEDLLACSAVDTSLDGETRSSIFDISGRSLLLATKKVSGFDEEVDATDTWLNSAFAVVTIVMVLVVIVHAYLVVHHLRHAARATSAYMHELKEAEQEAREAAEHRDQFLAFLSHELRNPLFGLAGTVDEAAERAAYCQCHDVRDTVCEAFETLRECTQQIEGTLNTVVNVQNMTTGRIVLDESAFDVRALSREMRHFFQDQADCKRVVLLFHVDASVPEVVIGDRLRIAEVVSHLLRNAITHTRAGSTVSCTVTVRSPQPYMTRSISKASIVPVHVDQQYDHSLELSAVSRSIPSERSKRTSSSVASTNGPREEHELLWVVRDQGPGMSTEQMKRAFLPYTRERIANASNVGGANLGLPIVKLLCNQMGGTVRVRSGQGLGCEFTASMRLATASSEDVITPLPDDAALSVIMSEAGTGTASVPSHHVLHADELGLPPLPVHDSDLQKFEGRFLVVDDQRVNRRLVSRILSKVMPRASVDLAVDGVDAVAKVHAAEADGAPFSCVFMDIQMPLMSGIEATVKLRSEGYEVPVIAVTGGSLEEEIAKYQEAGMLAVIHKPCTRDGFSTTLKTYWWSHIAGPMGL